MRPSTEYKIGEVRQRGELHRKATQALREMIVTGELEPGQKLREKDLCDRLGISRTPLREAQKTLAGEQLVTLRPNKSAIVASLNFVEIEELYQVVANLESLAARLACERITEVEVSEILSLHTIMRAAFESRDVAKYMECNQEIHRRIVHGSRNNVLIGTWTALSARMRRARRFGLVFADRWPEAIKEHDAMLAALLTRDGPQLSSMMVPHFEAGLAAVKTGLGSED